MNQKKATGLREPERAAALKDISERLRAFSDKYRASYVCLILTPMKIEKAGGEEWVTEEDVFLDGHGPKDHLLDALTRRLEDIDDGTEDQGSEN